MSVVVQVTEENTAPRRRRNLRVKGGSRKVWVGLFIGGPWGREGREVSGNSAQA